MAPNGLNKAGKEKKRAASAGKNRGPLESENDLDGVNFFFEIDPDPGVPYAFGRGSPTRRGGGSLTRSGGGSLARRGGRFWADTLQTRRPKCTGYPAS